MKISSPIVVVALMFGAVVLLSKRLRPVVVAPGPPRNINDLVPSPSQNASWWSYRAIGNPALTSPYGGGSTPGPVSQYLNGRGIVSGPVPSSFVPWRAPTAGRGPNAGASRPGGAFHTPGPYPPASGMAYAQSPVSSASPWLPQSLELITPVAANTWFYNLSTVDPYVALAAGSGGYIDVSRVDPGAALRTARGGR